jgi:small subunit ribosomal protein S1
MMQEETAATDNSSVSPSDSSGTATGDSPVLANPEIANPEVVAPKVVGAQTAPTELDTAETDPAPPETTSGVSQIAEVVQEIPPVVESAQEIPPAVEPVQEAAPTAEPGIAVSDLALHDGAAAIPSEVPNTSAPIELGTDTAGTDTAGTDTAGTDTAGTDTAGTDTAETPVFTYQPGDIVPGLITVIGPNGIEADLGEGELAVIPKAELVEGHEPIIGEQIEGTVVRHQAGSGRYVISPKRAHRTRSWTRIEAAFEAGEPISGVVKSTTKGGLILDLGIRAFLPESLIDVRKVSNIGSLVGTTMIVKIVECEKITGEQAATERRSEKIVVNRRVIIEKERQAERAALLSSVKVGERRTGTITALTDFGAFVDIGGGEGLIHISELAHRQIAKPSDVVKVGDSVDVVVLDVKADRNKISLSRKATLPNPWDQFSALHKPGDLVFGTVSGLAAFGVFVTIEGEGFEPVEGLVHISELSRFRVEQASDVVAVGEGVWSQILSIDSEKRRVALSMRRALE